MEQDMIKNKGKEERGWFGDSVQRWGQEYAVFSLLSDAVGNIF